MNVTLQIPPEEVRAELRGFFDALRGELRAEAAELRREAIRAVLADPEVRAALMAEVINELRLSPAGITSMVDISERTLRRWEEDGDLAANRKMPGKPLFRLGDVLSLTQPGTATPAATANAEPAEVLGGYLTMGGKGHR